MLSIDETSEDVECEDLVKIIIGDDPKKFFKSDPATSTRDGGVNRVP